jgi:hypothetical protein
MVNTRRGNRKNNVSRKNRNSRKNRKANRKNRKSSRKNRRNNMSFMGGRNGLFGTLYSPVSHILQATGEGVGAVTNTTRNITKRGLGGVDKIGRSVTGHANAAVRNLVSRKRRGSRKNRRN